ncbi:BREX-2 system adenine-specific DNA-methyltransferase PglX [Streptomyces sp. NPDC096097]|uniref:BREX-2 system adenine-specific DNA-methyltransferase PglX n=1 Tax=Streptomyces sp. NPDC096097 TaxID=3155546 RepID=UPI00332F6D2A
MISTHLLTRDLARQATSLAQNLRTRAEGTTMEALAEEYRDLREASAISSSWEAWLDEQAAQAAKAWVLATVLVRFCEDNGLLDSAAIVDLDGPPTDARASIVAAMDRLCSQPTTAQVFGLLNGSMRKLHPGREACAALLEFWNGRSPDGLLVHDFTDEARGTDFLHELYSGLDGLARATYGQVATPAFVVDLILDHTLEPAAEEFAPSLSGLQDLRIIDPACGSGTFLTSAFDRLFLRWTRLGNGMTPWQCAARTLRALHGCDIDPCAVTVTRFSLLLRAMNTVGERRLEDVPDLPIVVAAGDALIHGREAPHSPALRTTEPNAAVGPGRDIADYAERYGLFDPAGYHVVVSNPPYITVKDKALFAAYRDAYESCRGRYALTVPFTELAFHLANGRAGYVGELVANSFMKREFGQQLIERVLTRVEISHVIDTSGAYIPGHGTPTAILLGRSRTPDPARPVHVVVGREGESAIPVRPAEGVVWQSLRAMSHEIDAVNPWTESFLQHRSELSLFPWNLAQSTSRDLVHRLEAGERLRERVARIGYAANTGSDDLFCAPPQSFDRCGAEEVARVPILTGSGVRDWSAQPEAEAFFPRSGYHLRLIELEEVPRHHRRLWPYKTVLRERAGVKDRDHWYDWHQVAPSWNVHPWSIAFPWVSTHPHFSLLRGFVTPLNSAPVIKLPPNASDTDHLQLLGVLNSSAACFWLKQMSQSKGQPRADQRRSGESWERIYEYTSTRLNDLPLPDEAPLVHAEELDGLAAKLTAQQHRMSDPGTRLTPEYLRSAEREWHATRSRMISVQEELDWQVYDMYGLLPEGSDLVGSPSDVPPIGLGQRAFEIALARRVATGETRTAWFARHAAAPLTELPHHWPSAYRDLVQRRLEAIRTHATLGLLEQADYKRRWSTPGWQHVIDGILRDRMLDLCERPGLWFTEHDGSRRPVTRSVRELAELLESHAEFVELAASYAPRTRILDVLCTLLSEEHVPAAAALRYKPTGLKKQYHWTALWDGQRREEATQANLSVPLPPRFTSSDFLKPSYWRQRGKFDVPNERFTSYLPPFSALAATTVIGWAGWEAEERAQALFDLLGSSMPALTGNPESALPLLAALQETLPWVPQTGRGANPFEPSDTYEEMQAAFTRLTNALGITSEDVAAWRPPAPKRGRPPRQST